MGHKARTNLTGFWVGRYAYAGGAAPPVSFLATMEEGAGGALSGTISEPNSIGMSSRELSAFLSGQREGRAVSFAKTYDGASDAAHRVEYSGELSEDGRRIAGHWIVEYMTGPFEMTREILDEQAEEDEMKAEIKEPLAEPTLSAGVEPGRKELF